MASASAKGQLGRAKKHWIQGWKIQPTTSNPQWASSKMDQSTKFVGLSHPMTFEADDIIIVFMTEYQRCIFQSISTTLLVNVIPIAYRVDGYYLLTLFILGE